MLGPARLHSTFAVDPKAPRPPVLLVHGGYHGAWCWDAWVNRLVESGHSVHAIDLRGHGGLEPPPDFVDTGFGDMADDVAAAIDTIGEPPLLVGHSMGGLIVLLAAARRSVTGLLLLAPSPPGNLAGARPVATVPDGAVVPPPSPAVARARYAPHLDDADAETFAAKLCAESPRMLNERYDLRVPVDPAALTGIPSLVVEGGRDDPERHPPGQDRAIADLIGADHLYLADAPHTLMMGPGWPGWFTAIWQRVDKMV